MTKYLLIVIVILLFALAGLSKIWFVTVKDRNRISDNQAAFLSEIRYFKLADSTNAATIGTLSLKISEIRNSSNPQLEEMKSTLKLMNIKLRDIDSYSTVNTETTTLINSFLRDSVIFDTVPIKHLSISTQWNDVTLSVFPLLKDSISMRVITYDQMEQVLHKEGRGAKFWQKSFWKKRPIKQTIRFQNPDTKISYPTVVKIK
jgi:type II secretory pathway pseudopilin PulG